MQFDNSKYKKLHGYEEGKDVLDAASLQKAADYKKNVLKNFTAIYRQQILERFGGSEYHITRKYDGEYAIIFYQDGQTVTVNRSGRTRRGIPCIDEAGRLIQEAGIKQGIFPAEIYVEAGYKTRVNDLISALGSKGDITTLRLAVFDIMEINGEPFRKSSYADVAAKLREIFSSGSLCHPADYQQVSSGQQIVNLWEQWVDKEGSEGLIVHTRTPMSFKIKPRHFFDAVIIAYGEGSGIEVGQVRRMLFAFMPRAGQYQIMSRVGSGLNEKLRKQLFRYFEGKQVENPVKGTNEKWNDLVFVRPELVIEVAVEEIVTELASGEKMNTVLSFDGKQYRYEGTVPGFKTYTPVFVRLREDKAADEHDAGTGQIERFLSSSMRNSCLPSKHEILYRDVVAKNGKMPSHNSYLIWKEADGFVMLESRAKGKKTERELTRSGNYFDLFNVYQKSVTDDMSKGFIRDKDKIIMSDTCLEIMSAD